MKNIQNILGKGVKALGHVIGSGFKGTGKIVVNLAKGALKLFGLKNMIIVGLVAVIGVLIYLGVGGGFGGGEGDGEGDGNSAIRTSQESHTPADSSPPVEEASEAVVSTEVVEEEPVAEMVILVVNVVGNDYFYNNERISLEKFMEVLAAVEGQFRVEIKDDEASLKAYEKLVDELEERNYKYVEE